MRSHTLFWTVGNAALISMARRLGCAPEDLECLPLRQPDAVARDRLRVTRAHDRHEVRRANATLVGAVTPPAFLWALVGDMVTTGIARPAIWTGRPDGSVMSWLTYLTERVDGSPLVKSNTSGS